MRGRLPGGSVNSPWANYSPASKNAPINRTNSPIRWLATVYLDYVCAAASMSQTLSWAECIGGRLPSAAYSSRLPFVSCRPFLLLIILGFASGGSINRAATACERRLSVKSLDLGKRSMKRNVKAELTVDLLGQLMGTQSNDTFNSQHFQLYELKHSRYSTSPRSNREKKERQFCTNNGC